MKYIFKIIISIVFITLSLGANNTIDLTGTLRDFKESHPDFQLFFKRHNWNFSGLEQNMVKENLGNNRKPIFNKSDKLSTTQATFNQWYNDVAGINLSMPYTITLTKNSNNLYVYDSDVNPKGIVNNVNRIGFFPLDNLLFKNEGNIHNYHMTYEIHSSFTYQGGETFEFIGDDDVWVFIDNKLAVDIGGVHPKITDSVKLDELNLIKGKSYNFDMFWAERHTTRSNFKITTSIAFSNNKDFGDAPNNYTHVSHNIDEKLYLGNSVPDAEADQQSSTDATGDGADDSDGVVGTLPTLTVGDSSYTVPVKVLNNTGKDAYITAWIDFNRNGTFEFSEALNTNNLSIPSSSTPQTVNVVWDDFSDESTQAIATATEGKAIMRIRLTTERILRCIEDSHKNAEENLIAPDGEVEDYEITIQKDEPTEPFECNNEGIIFAGNSTYSTNSSTIVNTLDLETKVFNSDLQTTNRHINAIGYNVKDNLVYGIGFRTPNDDTAQLVKVDANYTMTYYDIPGLQQGDALYALGDVDFDNTFYVATIRNANKVSTYLTELTLIDLETKTIKKTIPLVFPTTMAQKRIISADFAFNPIDAKLYTVNSETNELCRIDPNTGVVEALGDVGTIDSGSYSVISFFDASGKFIFVNKAATTLYMIDISDPANVNTTASVYKSNLDLPSSGDGAKCAYSRLPEPKISGVFNIERTNSKEQAINTKERNAWYTQIVGRDFDYSLVFYKKDFSSEQNLSNVTLNVELVNMDNNKTLYEYKFHIPETLETSRFDISKEISDAFTTDLEDIEATRNARFRVSYAVDANGIIVQQDCMQGGTECSNLKTDYAKDNFAIRPETFYVTIADKAEERINSRTPNAKLKMAAGYDYNLSVIATQFQNTSPSKGYNKQFSSSFPFDETKLTDWNDNSSIEEQIIFENGLYSNTFSHDNVGYYTLDIPSDENWTKVDQESGDCIAEEATTSTTANEKSGCIIKQQTLPITLAYYPDHFEVNVALTNLPSSGHDDFIYMNSLEEDNNVAIAFQGTITARSENNVTTTNFILGGMATDLLLDLNASQVSVEGTNQEIHATDGTIIHFSRVVRFNSDNNFTNTTYNLTSIANQLTIPNATFLKENNGTMSLDMRYNLNKHLTAPVNPIEVTFESLTASSTPANSVSHEKLDPMYIPTGSTTFPNNVKQFYYAKVVSDRERYSRVNINLNPNIVTPLNIDIYCKANIANYCNDRDIHLHGNSEGTTRDQNGWFISSNHNGELDGNVTNLTENNDIVNINPNEGVANTTLPNGHNPDVSATFTTTTCTPDNTTVTITTSPALAVTPASTYQLSCTGNAPSTWTGTGKTGHTINTSPNIDKSNRMNW